MRKSVLFVLILAAIVLFASGDYLLNIYQQIGTDKPAVDAQDPNLTEALVSKTSGFKLEQRSRSTQLFERFDLSDVKDLRVYVNRLSQGTDSQGAMTIYEIQGPSAQGNATYLAVKLALVDQMDATGNINEESKFGNNSLFYNDINHPNTGYLLCQIGDNLFGFQYNKADASAFETVRRMVDTLMLLL